MMHDDIDTNLCQLMLTQICAVWIPTQCDLYWRLQHACHLSADHTFPVSEQHAVPWRSALRQKTCSHQTWCRHISNKETERSSPRGGESPNLKHRSHLTVWVVSPPCFMVRVFKALLLQCHRECFLLLKDFHLLLLLVHMNVDKCNGKNLEKRKLFL